MAAASGSISPHAGHHHHQQQPTSQQHYHHQQQYDHSHHHQQYDAVPERRGSFDQLHQQLRQQVSSASQQQEPQQQQQQLRNTTRRQQEDEEDERVREEIRGSYVRGYFADAPTIHALPTFYVMGAAFAAVSTLTAFLQTTVIPSTGHFAVFFFGAFTCFSSYYMASHFLGEHARSFQRISPEKKMYTVSNLIKAGVLAAITPLAVAALYKGMLHDDWDTNTLRNLGCIYAIPDFVALIVVRRMAPSTYVHHICVLVFCFSALSNDFSQENAFRALAVYGSFSTFGYITFMLLATRFLGVSDSVAKALASLACAWYTTCCGVNWMWQLSYLHHLYVHHPHWTIYVYPVAMGLVVYDDLLLCRWLFRRSKNMKLHAAQSSPAVEAVRSSLTSAPVGQQPAPRAGAPAVPPPGATSHSQPSR